jgi:small subunit ribosomal protein S21
LTLVRVSSDESFEKALRRFKKSCEKNGILADIRRHEHFEKPSERRKRKLNAAKRKVRRLARIQERRDR